MSDVATETSGRGWLTWNDAIEPLIVFAVSRCIVLAIGLAARLVLPLSKALMTDPLPGNLLLDGWIRWDSQWYLNVVERGYYWDASSRIGTTAFFPLYPLLIKALAVPIGNAPVAGLLVSAGCFAAALVLLSGFVAERFGRAVARRTLLFVCCAPFALFYGALYTESLFLLLSVACFMLAERDRWWWAGLVGALATATRLIGLALGPALLLLYLQQRGWSPRKLDRRIVALGLVPLGMVGFAAYLWSVLGDPFAFLQSSLYGWGRYNVFVSGLDRLNPAVWYPGNYDLVLGVDLALGVLWLASVIPTWRLIGPPYAIFVGLATAIPLSAGLESLGRYVGVLFPAYVVLAYYVRGRAATSLALVGGAALLGLFTILFVNWYWIV